MIRTLRRVFGRHLDLLDLERYVAGDLSVEERGRLLRHLEACAGCRRRLQWVRALPDRLKAATRPPLPEDLEEQALARRAAGGQVILPVHDPTGGGRRPGVTARAAAAAVTLIVAASGGILLLRAPEASARWSDLAFEPAQPRAGERVRVSYDPAGFFSGEDHLVLRGRVSGPPSYAEPSPRPETLATLRREDGRFRATFTLPPGAVYAQLAVEDPSGARVDDRGGRMWHLHVHGRGRPARDALWAHALLAADWEDQAAALRRATRLYPEDPRLRASLLSLDLEVLAEAERDSALGVQRALFSRLAGPLERQDALAAHELAGLAEYARTVGDTAAARSWTERLVREHPAHPEAVWYRVPPPPAGEDSAALRDYLARLEALWGEVGPHPAITTPGFWAARRLGDGERVLEWAERYAAHPGWTTDPPGRAALLLADVPAVRAEAREWLRRALRRLDDDVDRGRPLGRTVQQHRQDREDSARPLLVALGESLLADGRREAALDTLRRASKIGWSRPLFRRLAELELAMGDTTAAVTTLARAAAPSFERGGERGLELSRGPELVPPEEWALLRRTAQDEMYRSLLSRCVMLPLRTSPVWLYDSDGERHTLGTLTRGTVTVVAFWEPWSGPAVRDLPRLGRVAHLVRGLGGEVVAITESRPGDRASTLLEEAGVALPLYHDRDRRASEAFAQYGAPEYFVLDYERRIRFVDSDLDDIVAQVDALLNEPRLLASRQPASDLAPHPGAISSGLVKGAPDVP